MWWKEYLILCSFTYLTHGDVEIWGPGLSPDTIVMPARYFFVKTSNTTESNLIKNIQIDIAGVSKHGACRVWMNKLDRKDGSLIIRYKLYDTCNDFRISVLYNKRHIHNSPWKFKGPIQPDTCYCPNENPGKWLQQYGCPQTYSQLMHDLKPFLKVNMNEHIKIITEKFNQPNSISLCHYVIKSNMVYRKCYGKHVGFQIFADAILLSLARKVVLPDTQFFINLGDWPLVRKTAEVLPIFSWCGSNDTFDIVLPTYDITESTLENMGRVMLDMLSVQGNIDYEWKNKTEKAFWRGRDSREERLTLVDIARQNPDLYDVAITNYFFFRDKEQTYGPRQSHVSFFKFFDYKYQLNIDGTVAAYRFPYLLAGDSLVLKQDSGYYEHFYRDLKPNFHYLPFKADLSDLTSKILWAKNNDEKAHEIARNGQEFARKYLMPREIICYHAVAFLEWTKRLTDEVTVVDDMEHVPQLNVSLECHCPGIEAKDEL